MLLRPYEKKTRLCDSTNVQRVHRNSNLNFVKKREDPPRDLFNLSSEDKSEGEKRGCEPLLSVWQSSINRETLMKNLEVNFEESVIYELNVGEIHKIRVRPSMTPVEVHSDPVDMPLGNLHAGIQGLYRKLGLAKSDYKNVKEELTRLARKT